MKIHKITTYYIDTEDVGSVEIRGIISNHRHLCVKSHQLCETIEVKNWDDNHPMNDCFTDSDKWWEENKSEITNTR